MKNNIDDYDVVSEELKLINAIESCEDIKKLRHALRSAMSVIANYRMDIANTGGGDPNLDFVGVDLAKIGFCQGCIYLEVHSMLRHSLVKEG